MQNSLGVIDYPGSQRGTDFLYRLSLKCLIQNKNGEVLVVKERKRTSWDLPGGGMNHDETIKTAIAREMKEEVNLNGDFAYQIIDVEEPAHLITHNFWQIRLIFAVKPQIFAFSPGDDGDEIAFMDATIFKNSTAEVERKIYHYYVKSLRR